MTLTTTEGRDMTTKLDEKALRDLLNDTALREPFGDYPEGSAGTLVMGFAARVRDAALKEAADEIEHNVLGHGDGSAFAEIIRNLIPKDAK